MNRKKQQENREKGEKWKGKKGKKHTVAAGGRVISQQTGVLKHQILKYLKFGLACCCVTWWEKIMQ